MTTATLLIFLFQLIIVRLWSTSAFIQPSIQQQHNKYVNENKKKDYIRNVKQKKQRTSSQLEVVFNRLSEDCITALETAQEQASIMKQDEVDNNFMLLGLCISSGKASSTMEKYQITWKNVKRTLNYLVVPNRPSSTETPNLADFSDSVHKRVLPYSSVLQQTLNNAAIISQTMGSNEIHPEHVFLSLLEYKEVVAADTTTSKLEGQAATKGDDCDAMEILWHIDAMLEAEDICQSLLQTLMEEKKNESERAAKKAKRKGYGDANYNFVDDQSEGAKTSTISNKNKQRQQQQQQQQQQDETDETDSTLEKYSIDLTQEARDGQLDKVYGRDEEIQNCLRILVRRRKNNVCLIGEAGVGKTSIAEGLAQLLVSEDCPMLLKDYRIVSLEVGSLLSGTKFRGEFEERLKEIIEELSSPDAPKTILFLDEIHNLIGAGATEGGMDAANLLKPYLARGKLQVIGATTISEYVKYISKDAALERRLQPVLIKEPTVEQTVGILQTLLPYYQQHHRVEFTSESLEAAAKLSDRYIPERFLPDKAIDLLDEAGALATLTRTPNEPPPTVTEKTITDIISKWTSIPAGKLEIDEMDRLQLLEENISYRVKGQSRAIRTVAKAIRRARTGIRNPKRPIASLLFCGPTGTGKTELCKTLAESYFGSERDLIRIDMSEYMEKYAVSRLTGPPPGYAGYEEGGQLTEAVRRAPHSVVLLDELEKAHGDVLNILLQVMEDGILTDGKGRTVSFKNTIIIMTSNIGSKRILELSRDYETNNATKATVPISNDKSIDSNVSTTPYRKPEYSEIAGIVQAELESTLKPEFLNRFDDTVVFEPLTEEELSSIASFMVREIAARAKLERDIDIFVTPTLLQKMVQEGIKSANQFGARPMRRAVQRVLEDAISDSVVQGFLIDKDEAIFDYTESNAGNITLNDEDTTLKQKQSSSRSCYVKVSRSRDKEILFIDMEDSFRDLVIPEQTQASKSLDNSTDEEEQPELCPE